MVALRHYDRSVLPPGTQPLITPSGVRSGQLCYVGHGKYATCDVGGVDVLDMTSHAASADRAIATYSGGAAGDGLPKGIDTDRKGKLLVVLEQDVGLALHMKLRQYDIDAATLDWEHDFGAVGSAGPIVYNGIDWWLSHVSEVLPPDSARFLLLDISGDTVRIKRNIPHSNFVAATPANVRFTDMAYDDTFLWGLTGSFVSRWDVNGRAAPRNAWPGTFDGAAYPGVAHAGLTLSRTSHLTILSRN
jgi:hypothetical protein